MPWPNVLFRCDTLVRAVDELLRERQDPYRPTAMRPADRLWALNGATVASVARLVADLPSAEGSVQLAPLLSPLNRRWRSWRMKYYAFLCEPLRWVPGLREMFVNRILLTLVRQ